MNKQLITTVLPNNIQISCFDSTEAYILYHQVSSYIKYGVTLRKGDVVFDVGANIGLFSIWLYSLYEDSINVYSFEPVPDIYEVLKLNVEQLATDNISIFPFGLSNVSRQIEFGYYPNASALSSAYPDNSSKEKNMFLNSVINNLSEVSDDAPFSLKILKYLPRFVSTFAVSKMLDRAFEIDHISCEMKTLSDIISDHNISSIDLLKIDVEKSELDVIDGIKQYDWKKIRQTVIEVHDINNRVSELANTLKQKGFSRVNIEQEADLKGTNIYCIYALR